MMTMQSGVETLTIFSRPVLLVICDLIFRFTGNQIQNKMYRTKYSASVYNFIRLIKWVGYHYLKKIKWADSITIYDFKTWHKM